MAMFYWTPINKSSPQGTSLDQPNCVKAFDITFFFFGFLPVKEIKIMSAYSKQRYEVMDVGIMYPGEVSTGAL